jgi:hypothetical protein
VRRPNLKGLGLLSVVAVGAALALVSGGHATATWSVEARVLANDDHSANVAIYDRALNRVKPKCNQSRHRVAALVWSSKRVLRGDDYNYSNLSLLRALNRAVPASLAPTNCGQILAALIVLIEKG